MYKRLQPELGSAGAAPSWIDMFASPAFCGSGSTRSRRVFPARRRPLLSAGLDECRHVFGPDLVKVRISRAKDRPQQSVGEAEIPFSGAESDTGHALQMLVENLQPVFHTPGRGWHSLYLRGHCTLATKHLD